MDVDEGGSYTELECSSRGSGESLLNPPEVVAEVFLSSMLPPPELWAAWLSYIFSKILIRYFFILVSSGSYCYKPYD